MENLLADSYIPQSPKEYLEIFKKRKAMFFLAFFNVLLIAAVVYPFLPKAYESSVLLQVDDLGLMSSAVQGLGLQEAREKSLKLLTMQILSVPTIRAAAKELGYDQGLDQLAFEKRVEKMRKRIKVVMISEGLLQISYQDKERESAQKGADAIVKSVVETNRAAKMGEAETAIEFIDQQLRIYKERLRNSERTFLLTKTNTEIEALQQQRRLLADQLAQIEKTSPSDPRRGNPLTFELRKELVLAENQLQQLLLTAKKEHPIMEELRQKVAMLRKRLALEKETGALSEGGGASNPAYRDAAAKLRAVDMEIDSIRRRQEDLKGGKVELKGISEAEALAMERDKKVNEDIYQSLLKRMENAHISQRLDALGQGAAYKVLEPARLPLRPATPDPLKTGVVVFGLAFMAGFGSVFLKEYMDSSFRGVRDAKSYLKLPLLAYIPEITTAHDGAQPSTEFSYVANLIKDPDIAPQIVTFHDPNSIPAEQYRLLRTHLVFMSEKHPLRTVMITSALEGEGKTTTAVNLAISMAHDLGRKVLLVDCDLRKGGVEKSLGLPRGKGLGNYLADQCSADAIQRKTRVAGLTVVTAGENVVQSPTKLLSSEKMAKFIETARPLYDFIILDAPPVLYLADVPVLTQLADGILLVVQIGKTPRELAGNALAALEQTRRANTLGAVLTRVDHSVPAYIQHYLEGSN